MNLICWALSSHPKTTPEIMEFFIKKHFTDDENDNKYSNVCKQFIYYRIPQNKYSLSLNNKPISEENIKETIIYYFVHYDGTLLKETIYDYVFEFAIFTP
jgi:hypothetical protein